MSAAGFQFEETRQNKAESFPAAVSAAHPLSIDPSTQLTSINLHAYSSQIALYFLVASCPGLTIPFLPLFITLPTNFDLNVEVVNGSPPVRFGVPCRLFVEKLNDEEGATGKGEFWIAVVVLMERM